jgi:ABC-type bacteriocin/lantibiotic exporter with double-glycine peptidase domain
LFYTDIVGNRGIVTGSGKSSSQRLFLNQILGLSAYSKKELKLAKQIEPLETVLVSFGNAKTLMNPNASHHGRYLVAENLVTGIKYAPDLPAVLHDVSFTLKAGERVGFLGCIGSFLIWICTFI